MKQNMRMLTVAAAAVLCTACVSAPQRVREDASSALSCDASQVTVNRTERRYLGDAYEAVGCGQKLTYQCERASVLFIPVATIGCHKK
jgi:hypothetical protein